MAVSFSPIFNSQSVNGDGDPAVGWKVYSYVANSATPLATYTTETGDVQQSNPIVLNALGFPTTGQIWLTANTPYKLVLTDENDVVKKTEDNILGVPEITATQDEWVASGLTPTYVSATSFTLTGDQTAAFNVGRRLKTTNTVGTIYSTITASAFGAVTTVTVVNDSGTLDSGLSAVSYGLLSSANSSLPVRRDVIAAFADVTDPTKILRVDVANIPTGTTVVQSTGAGGILPAGIGPLPYAGSSVPTGWLECDGSAVSRTTYAALFAAISTTWGIGDNSTTFNLPNMRDRVPIGSGTGTTTESVTASSSNGFTVASNNTKWITGMSVVLSSLTGFTTSATAGPTYYIYRASATNVRLCSTLVIAQNGTTGSMETISGTGTATLTHTYTARTLGEYGGEEGHAISVDETLAHVHTITHTHTQTVVSSANQGTTGTMGSSDASTTADGNTGASSAANSGSLGGNAAMNTMQPFAVVKYIISY